MTDKNGTKEFRDKDPLNVLRKILRELKPAAVADATLRKQAADTNCDAAAIVIGIGPGFTVGVNVHAIVETMRGHNLGKVLLSGSALPNTG